MLLIRHNRIKPPYHDYEALSLDQLDALATDKVAPDIADLPANLPFDESELSKVDGFICSTSNRTQQTCMVLCQRFGLAQPLERDACLNELYFVPSQLERNDGESALAAVRRNLYPAIAAGSSAVEPASQIKNRMDELLGKYAGKNLLLFSHGFYMRLVQSYAASGRDMAKALATIENYPTVGYLELRRI